jgi:isoleucyl-tRNA synthetase
VVDDLSNWYIRRNRRRFWKPGEANEQGGMGKDKLSAYQTLYHVLLTISKLIAPFIPFLSEELYQNLKAGTNDAPESVHLCFYPDPGSSEFQYRNEQLEQKMAIVLQTVNMGRSLRNQAAIKIRQPLSEIIIYSPQGHQEKLITGMENLIKEELNIKNIRFTSDYSDLVARKAEPIYKAIGPKFGKFVNQAAEKIRSISEASVLQLEKDGYINFILNGNEFKITKDDVEIRTENRDNLVVEQGDELTVGLNLVLTEALINEGMARDFVNRVQNMRKEADFSVTDRIIIYYHGSNALQKAINSQADYIKNETLANDLINKIEKTDYQKEWKINDEKIVVGIYKI